ncbi:hypothetical protein EYF80_052117 [Liparis tanakae]|uniref:Uncharacterized protein n=1 Tax=Liparis tanakae TaxID=230148 RepID=A0A4Z2F9Y6_9TELE|nr:hypothetical protein EYF80_052117 [Liparis tanakae]
MSCSNISDVRSGFREEDSAPVVFASGKHGRSSDACKTHQSVQERGKRGFAALDRGLSRSEEGLVPDNESDLGGEQSRVRHINHGHLYKAASLNRSLTFSEEDFLLGVSKGPKRAVSSSQLPGKGILKNKEPHADIRKAKSMEVLSPRVSAGHAPSGPKGTPQGGEQAKANVMQGKLNFSAFLDEITKQVISPSALTILGVNSGHGTGRTPGPAPTPGPVQPQLPPKRPRESSGGDRQQRPRQQQAARGPRKASGGSLPESLISYAARTQQGSPPPHHPPRSPSHCAPHESHTDRRPWPAGGSVSGDRWTRGGPPLEEEGTSPEPGQPKPRGPRTQPPPAPHGQHAPPGPQHQPPAGHRGPAPRARGGGAPGIGSESSSTASDSPRARGSASTASGHGSPPSGRQPAQHGQQPRSLVITQRPEGGMKAVLLGAEAQAEAVGCLSLCLCTL